MFAFLFIQLCVPGYVILQIILPRTYSGGWRIAALMPLGFTIPTALWSLHALANGSRFWPLTLLIAAPLALGYLIMLTVARHLFRGLNMTGAPTS